MCFFYTPVDGGKTRTVETESEFSPNKLELFEAGKNYFIRRFIKVGLMVGGADLEQVTEAQGKADVKLEPASRTMPPASQNVAADDGNQIKGGFMPLFCYQLSIVMARSQGCAKTDIHVAPPSTPGPGFVEATSLLQCRQCCSARLPATLWCR